MNFRRDQLHAHEYATDKHLRYIVPALGLTSFACEQFPWRGVA